MLRQPAETTCSLRRYFCLLVLLLTYFMNLLATWVLLSGPAECAERLQSAAPPQVAPRAKSKIKVLAKYLQAQDAQLQKPRPRSPDYPLSISPPGHAHSAGPTQKSVNLRRWTFKTRFCSLPKSLRKMTSKNHRKKSVGRGSAGDFGPARQNVRSPGER